MNLQRIAGIVVLLVGVALLLVGINGSNSLVDQVSSTFTGRFTQATMWYLIGGGGFAALGLFLLLVRIRGKWI